MLDTWTGITMASGASEKLRALDDLTLRQEPEAMPISLLKALAGGGRGMTQRLLWAGALLLAAAGCSSGEQSKSAKEAPAVTLPPKIEQPKIETHNYAEKEGDIYSYVTAVTEEDEKKGKAVGEVIRFRYSGIVNDKYVLEGVDDSDRPFSKAECGNPCRVIKRTVAGQIDRIPFNPASVIGSAFDDAMGGRLDIAKSRTRKTVEGQALATEIPKAFLGEWNENIAECGTASNDSALKVGPEKIRFYESEAETRDVKILNARSISVSASFAGEGQTWNNTFTMVLSGSGDDLTIDGYTRHRCP